MCSQSSSSSPITLDQLSRSDERVPLPTQGHPKENLLLSVVAWGFSGVSQILLNSLTCPPHHSYTRNGSLPLPKERTEQGAQLRKPLLIENRNQELHLRHFLLLMGELDLLELRGHLGPMAAGPSGPLLPAPCGLGLSSVSHSEVSMQPSFPTTPFTNPHYP